MSTQSFTYELLRGLRSAKPFRPFVMVTRSGQAFEALRPMWFGGNAVARTLGVYHPSTGYRRLTADEIAGIRTMADDEIASRAHYMVQRKRA